MTKINDRFDIVTGPPEPVKGGRVTVIQLPGETYGDRMDSSQPNFGRYINPIPIRGGGEHRNVTNNF